jgi:outer membrane autotransporter protein
MSYKKAAGIALALLLGSAANTSDVYAAPRDQNVDIGYGATTETGTETNAWNEQGNPFFSMSARSGYGSRFIFDPVFNYENPILLHTDLMDTLYSAYWIAGNTKVIDPWSYNKVTVDGGAIWRPMDSGNAITTTNPSIVLLKAGWLVNAQSQAFITMRELNTSTGAKIDLQWLNVRDGGADMRFTASGYTVSSKDGSALDRHLYADTATLADNTTFRLGVYKVNAGGSAGRLNDTHLDNVYIKQASSLLGNTANIYIELGWVPGIDENGTVTSDFATYTGAIATNAPVALGIFVGGENFNVEARGSFADGVFSKYFITPELTKHEDFFLKYDDADPLNNPTPVSSAGGTAWLLTSYSFYTSGVSESGMASGDAAVAAGLLGKTGSLSMFRGTGYLHGADFGKTAVTVKQFNKDLARDVRYLRDADGGYVLEGAQKENVWAEAWHGKWTSASGYGRRITQSYNGLMAGYDKMLSKDFYNGKAYAGFYIGKLEGRTGIETGGGKQDVKSVGVYSVWSGNRGHYLDLGLQAAKLSSELRFTDSNGPVEGKYSTWGYTLGAQYGFKNQLESGWFVEPQAGIFYGQSNGVDYELSNHLFLTEKESKSLTGRIGFKAGKELSEYGNLYLQAAVLRDFKDRAGLTMHYGTQSQSVDMPGGKDTWYELGLGGNIRTSSNSNLKLDFVRTLGGNTGDEWRINALLEWTWGGQPGEKDRTAALTEESFGAARLITPAVSENGGAEETGAAQSGETNGAQTGGAKQTAETDADSKASPPTDGYTLPGLTVEADRPAWERELSPGSVSVVYPEEYKGEHKTLPDLLERVPGLFVQRVNGVGHYTVARVRASTAAQVHVYVDGVLMNLNGDAAVNLSNIPVENVERVEVYKGYIPARFSGSPLGGVINIVTKKPGKPGWYIAEGFRSYGGYRGSYEYTAPLGQGSLMLGYNRDIWNGDFPFEVATLPPGKRVLHLTGNDYRNSDALVKWQDDNWTVKFAWKKNWEYLPYKLNRNLADTILDSYESGERNRMLQITQTEFQIGRRDTVGNLDWGWKTYYLDSRKRYRWPYGIANLTTLWDRSPGAAWSDYDSQKWGVNLNATMKMGENHLMELNLDYSRESLDGNGSDWDEWDSNYYTVTQGRQFLRHYKIKEYHLSLQDTVRLNSSGDFRLTPMLKADKVDMGAALMASDQRWMYSGGVGLRKDFGKAWTLKATWGTYNRHPNFYEIFGDGANIRPNIEHTHSWNLAKNGTWETGTQTDFSIDWHGEALGAKSNLILTLFRREAKNELVLSVPPMAGATARYLPLSGTKAHGAELSVNVDWRRVNFSLGITRTTARYHNGTGNPLLQSWEGSEFPWIPKWTASARVDYTLPGDRLSLFAEYHYTGEQRTRIENARDADFLEALGTINLGAKYSFGKGFKLSVGVNDVFNKAYEQQIRMTYNNATIYKYNPPYPLPGRMYYVTLEYKF